MDSQGASQSTPRSSVHNDTDSEKKYKFWTFQQCNETICGYRLGPETHLIINEIERDTKTIDDSPVPFAVSYAWGTSPRKKYYLGHDLKGRAYHLELGGEWDRDKFLERLVHYSSKTLDSKSRGLRPGWLDRVHNRREDPELTMPEWLRAWTKKQENNGHTNQDDPKALKDIPFVFQRCEVIVFFPGSYCGCVYRNAAIEDSKSPDCITRNDAAGDSEIPDCLNYINLVTWWTRLWPRQEFVYANKITADWNDGDRKDNCLRGNDIDKTSLKNMVYLCGIQYTDLFRLQARTRGRPCQKKACQALLRWQIRFTLEVMLISRARKIEPPEVVDKDNIARIVEDWFQKRDAPANPIVKEPGEEESGLRELAHGETTLKESSKDELCPCQIAINDLKAYQDAHLSTMNLALKEKQAHAANSVDLNGFLRGKSIETGQWSHQRQLPEPEQFERFWFRLGVVSRSKREVTKPKDLVLAVWPECYGWMPPPKLEGESKKECEAFLEMLNGGLEHLKNKHLALITTAPRGLFQEQVSLPSWEWAPDEYMKCTKCKASKKECNEFPVVSSYAYGTMVSPFVPVSIISEDGSKLLPLEYHQHFLGRRRSLLATSELLEEKFPMEKTAPREATPEETQKEHERLEMIKSFIDSVVQHWPKSIQDRCRGPRQLILEMVLKKMNTFVSGSAMPKIATDVTADMTAWGFYTTKLVLRHRAHLIILLTLMTGKDLEAEKGSWFKTVLDTMGIISRGPLAAWAQRKLEEEKQKQHSDLYLNPAMQVLRDQLFHDHALRRDSDAGELDHTKADLSKETRVHHLDTIYYMVAEALGFHPDDLGLDYNQSFNKDSKGEAYKKAKPFLVTSTSGGNPMLGLMAQYCYKKNAENRWTRRSGVFMTVAFRVGSKRRDPNQEAETCLYEVEMLPGQSTSARAKWRIVGVWVPVKSPVKNMVSGWFGPGAKADAMLV